MNDVVMKSPFTLTVFIIIEDTLVVDNKRITNFAKSKWKLTFVELLSFDLQMLRSKIADGTT